MKTVKGRRDIFILIDAETGEDEEDLIERLLAFEEVVEVHVISGQYEFIVVAQIDLHGQPIWSTVQDLSQKLVKKIRKVKGVRDTNTIVPFLTATK